jgi:hypothetical protein
VIPGANIMTVTTLAPSVVSAPKSAAKLGAPKPPACVTQFCDEVTAIRRQEAEAKARLVDELRESVQSIIDANGLWSVIGALEVILKEQKSPMTGLPVDWQCAIQLRAAHEQN